MNTLRTVSFEVEDKNYQVRFDYNAITDMEELMNGEPILSFIQKGSMNTVRILIWGGVKWKIPGITKQQAGYIVQKLIEEKKLKKVMTDVTKCLQYALQEIDGEEVEEQTEGEL